MAKKKKSTTNTKYNEDTDQYEKYTEEESEPVRIMTTDLDHSYLHYGIPHVINDDCSISCRCKEITDSKRKVNK